MSWDGVSAVVVGDVVSWNEVKSVVRWVGDTDVIIEGADTGYCLKVDIDSLSVYAEAEHSPTTKLQAVIDAKPDGVDLAEYLISMGVQLA